jgi:hypothetical protein
MPIGVLDCILQTVRRASDKPKSVNIKEREKGSEYNLDSAYLDQGSPNYGQRAGSGPPYTFILPANVINTCLRN